MNWEDQSEAECASGMDAALAAEKTTDGKSVPSNVLLDFSVLTKKDFENAAMIVITVPESHDGHTDLMPLRDLVPNGCLIAFIRPGESIAALSEDQMRDMGWVKSNSPMTVKTHSGKKESPWPQ